MIEKRIDMRFLLFLLIPFLFIEPAMACVFSRGEKAVVEDAIGGDSLKLTDGREVRLLGIYAPQPAIAKAAAEAYADEAYASLAQWAKGKQVTLHFVSDHREDRYGRVLAHVSRDDGAWLQARMIEAGLARVQSSRDNRACISELLVLEKSARAAKRGLWASSYYAVGETDDLASLLRREGSYQIVEGKVVDVASRQKRLYFNFGDDWRTDFTVRVEPSDARLFLEGDATIPLKERVQKLRDVWKGKRVRVRGWVENYNGPAMQVTHPEQLELVDEDASKDKRHAQ